MDESDDEEVEGRDKYQSYDQYDDRDRYDESDAGESLDGDDDDLPEPALEDMNRVRMF